MKKLIVLLILATLALFWLYFSVRNEAEPSPSPKGALSARAREYLREQGKDDQRWSRLAVQEDKPSPHQILGGRLVRVGSCFELEIPFPIESVKDKGECFDLFGISSPKGRITAYQRHVSVRTLEEVPEVQMRRLQSDVYVEQRQVFGGREFIIFQKKGSHYQKTAFRLAGDRLFVLSFVAYSQAGDLAGEFSKMLSSLKFLSDQPEGD